jgi:hypothetical protein
VTLGYMLFSFDVSAFVVVSSISGTETSVV